MTILNANKIIETIDETCWLLPDIQKNIENITSMNGIHMEKYKTLLSEKLSSL